MDPILLQADELGIRLEIVGGLPIWEAKPFLKHQRAVDQIRETIQRQHGISSETGCGCIHYADVYVAFPDGSQKRPDIAIFCQEPHAAGPSCPPRWDQPKNLTGWYRS